MRFHTLPLLLLFLVSPAQAQDKTKSPTLILRVQALDDLVSDVRFLAEQAGRGEEAKQAEKILRSMAGEQGLEGLDTTRPMALYVFVGSEGLDSQVVLMLPVAKEKTFLDTLDRLGVKSTKDEKSGLHETRPKGSPFPVYFRFANGYVYASLRDKEPIGDKRLLRPDVVLPKTEKDTLSLSLDLTSFPKDLRDLVIGQLELRIGDLKEKKEGETKAQHAFRESVLDEGITLLKSLLTDSTAVSLRFGVDRKAGEVSLSLGLAGKPGTALSKNIAAWSRMSSVVSGLVAEDSAAATRITYELPDNIQKSLVPVIDEGLKNLLSAAREDAVRELLKPLLDAAAPTLKQGRVDAALDFRGPSEKKLYTVVGGAAIRDGKDLEKVIKATLKQIPAEAAAKVSVDVAKVGEVNVHRLNVEKDLDEDTKKSLGENPIFFAIRDDALLFSMGEDGLAAIKNAIGAKSKVSPVMSLELSMKRLAPLMERDQKAAPKAAEDAFKGQVSDRVTIRVTGGEELRLRFGMSGAVLKFFALLDQAEKGGN
jgi:hypothetical protein